LYGEVLTTPQVVEELRGAGTPEAVRRWAGSPPAWIRVEAPLSVEFLSALDVGEASAISLARERGAHLILIDERAGTETARRVGLAAIGTLGVLIEAGVARLIDFEAAITRLVDGTPFYASRGLIEAARGIYGDRTRGGTG
jgi:predicted nucleic acid-binding protein